MDKWKIRRKAVSSSPFLPFREPSATRRGEKEDSYWRGIDAIAHRRAIKRRQLSLSISPRWIYRFPEQREACARGFYTAADARSEGEESERAREVNVFISPLDRRREILRTWRTTPSALCASWIAICSRINCRFYRSHRERLLNEGNLNLARLGAIQGSSKKCMQGLLRRIYSYFYQKSILVTTISVGRNLNLAPNETSCDSWFAIID